MIAFAESGFSFMLYLSSTILTFLARIDSTHRQLMDDYTV